MLLQNRIGSGFPCLMLGLLQKSFSEFIRFRANVVAKSNWFRIQYLMLWLVQNHFLNSIDFASRLLQNHQVSIRLYIALKEVWNHQVCVGALL
jgi:hypothetical protein